MPDPAAETVEEPRSTQHLAVVDSGEPEEIPPEPVPLEALRKALWQAAPPSLRRLARRARAEATAAAMERVPLPLYELVKLRTLDPFVARATAVPRDTTGVHFLILAALPLTEGAQHRSARLAHELLARRHRVTYVHFFPRSRRRRLARTVAHENLTLTRFSEFTARRFAMEKFANERLVSLVQLPLPEYVACATYLRQFGAETVYDCIDDWANSEGSSWYSRRAETTLLREASGILAPNRGLATSLEARAGRTVRVLPNGVDPLLFSREATHPRPRELPKAKKVFLHAGALTAEWFAWDWVRALALARPDAAVVLVGRRNAPFRDAPKNVHFLAPRPDAELPALIAHSHVCLVPVLGRRERGGQVKLLEYLAMGKPVVSTDLPDARDLEGVRVATSVNAFIEAVRASESAGSKVSSDVGSEHSWSARIRALEALVGYTAAP